MIFFCVGLFFLVVSVSFTDEIIAPIVNGIAAVLMAIGIFRIWRKYSIGGDSN